MRTRGRTSVFGECATPAQSGQPVGASSLVPLGSRLAIFVWHRLPAGDPITRASSPQRCKNLRSHSECKSSGETHGTPEKTGSQTSLLERVQEASYRAAPMRKRSRLAGENRFLTGAARFIANPRIRLLTQVPDKAWSRNRTCEDRLGREAGTGASEVHQRLAPSHRARQQ